MIDPGLKDRVVLITGGNNPQGIGAATAMAFAAQGAAVFIHYFRQPGEPEESGDHESTCNAAGMPFFLSMQAKSAEGVVQAICKKGGRATSYEGDLASPELIPLLFEQAEQKFGPVEVLVNNAADYLADTFLPATTMKEGEKALWEGGPFISTINVESHDRHFSVNSRAPALMMAEFARRHIAGKRHWGRIINVSADCSSGCPEEISYRASKHALESYSRSAAAELGPFGITVNIVAPGPVQTGYITPEMGKELAVDIPLRRVGQPEDIADVILFLASEQARWVTGQLIFVHGGHRMSLGR